jgi:hypothetical protein
MITKQATQCSLDESKETKGSESKNAKIMRERNVDYIFDSKDIIHHELAPGNQTVNSTFYKEVIKS